MASRFRIKKISIALAVGLTLSSCVRSGTKPEKPSQLSHQSHEVKQSMIIEELISVFKTAALDKTAIETALKKKESLAEASVEMERAGTSESIRVTLARPKNLTRLGDFTSDLKDWRLSVYFPGESGTRGLSKMWSFDAPPRLITCNFRTQTRTDLVTAETEVSSELTCFVSLP